MFMSKKFNGQYIIFDLMGVVFKEAHIIKDSLYPILRECNEPVSYEKVKEEYIKLGVGKVSEVEFWKAIDVQQSMPRKIFLEKLRESFDDDFMGLLSTFLGKTIGVLSNNAAEWAEYLLHNTGLENQIHIKLISGELGYKKPEKEIYDLLVQRCGGNPSNILFIDDKLSNLKAAGGMGIKTCLLIREPLTKPDYLPDFVIFELKQLEDLVEVN